MIWGSERVHPPPHQRPISFSPIKWAGRKGTRWIETQLENPTVVQMVSPACRDHMTLTEQVTTSSLLFSFIWNNNEVDAYMTQSYLEASLYIQLAYWWHSIYFYNCFSFSQRRYWISLAFLTGTALFVLRQPKLELRKCQPLITPSLSVTTIMFLVAPLCANRGAGKKGA